MEFLDSEPTLSHDRSTSKKVGAKFDTFFSIMRAILA